jgi:uncharacterized membrane protein
MSNAQEIFNIVLLSMLPIVEYQATIPLGILKYQQAPWLAYILSVFGSLLPMIPLYFGLQPGRALLTRWFPTYVGWLDRHLAKAQEKLAEDYNKYGALALFLALVIPFPFTGIWTMTAAAVLLKIPFSSTMAGIGLGLAAGAGVVLLLTMGVVQLSWFAN